MVLQLSSALTLNTRVATIALASTTLAGGAAVTVSGWGTTSVSAAKNSNHYFYFFNEIFLIFIISLVALSRTNFDPSPLTLLPTPTAETTTALAPSWILCSALPPQARTPARVTLADPSSKAPEPPPLRFLKLTFIFYVIN